MKKDISPSGRRAKTANLIKELSAQFLEKENNRTSLITVTACTVSRDFKKTTVFISVLPSEKEKSALDFVKRKRSELRDYLKKFLKTKNAPFVDVKIDLGEKNRQRIDELLQEK